MGRQSKWDGEVPFVEGKMQEWVGWEPWHGDPKPTMLGYRKEPLVWEKAEEFGATLRITRTTRGRSAVRFHVDDLTRPGRSYSMTPEMLLKAIKTYGMRDDRISGLWNFRKQGQNFCLIVAVTAKGKEEDAVEKIERFLSSGKVISQEELEAELDKEQRIYEDGPL